MILSRLSATPTCWTDPRQQSSLRPSVSRARSRRGNCGSGASGATRCWPCWQAGLQAVAGAVPEGLVLLVYSGWRPGCAAVAPAGPVDGRWPAGRPVPASAWAGGARSPFFHAAIAAGRPGPPAGVLRPARRRALTCRISPRRWGRACRGCTDAAVIVLAPIRRCSRRRRPTRRGGPVAAVPGRHWRARIADEPPTVARRPRFARGRARSAGGVLPDPGRRCSEDLTSAPDEDSTTNCRCRGGRMLASLPSAL